MHAATQMKPKTMMPGERSQSQETTDGVIPLTGNIPDKQIYRHK